MDIHDLQTKFVQNRDYKTDDLIDLMVFAKKAYIHNEITFKEYRQVVRELESQGAKVIDNSPDDSLFETEN
ncbi:YppF family protein [Neobacillus sp. PS3-34]|uniref:YppF family protein n=1 Tax=Neobacillus sp. PS3-34 TaxID=3070678 RepID=UPI0027DF0892|nr:YppF family protein [Neobacillus sp. PS3-34]WML47727.1 YppF family protein [Neobacillus sp. PS3-34]